MLGLKEEELRQIQKVLRRFPEVHEALLFGSRAKGEHKRVSDVDIALKGDISLHTVGAVKAMLDEETTLPYFFDVVNYHTLKNDKLREEIDRFGEALL